MMSFCVPRSIAAAFVLAVVCIQCACAIPSALPPKAISEVNQDSHVDRRNSGGGNYNNKKCMWNNQWYNQGDWYSCSGDHCKYYSCQCWNGKWKNCYNKNTNTQCYWDGQSYNSGDWVDCYEPSKCKYQHCQCSEYGKWTNCYNDKYQCKWNSMTYDVGYECSSQGSCYDNYDYCKCTQYGWKCDNSSNSSCDWNGTTYNDGDSCSDCNGHSSCDCSSGQWTNCSD